MTPQAVFAPLLLAAAALPAVAAELPARFDAGLVELHVRDGGRELRLYTDSGGGLFLRQEAVERLRLPTEAAGATMAAEMGADARTTRLPDFVRAAGVPEPSHSGGAIPVLPAGGETVLPGARSDDGMLGQAWFDGRVWTWDYPNERLLTESPQWRPPRDMRRVPLGFPADAQGERTAAFPRINVTIDGRELPLLLDTGAMTVLTPHALQALDDDLPAQRATSMIADSVFRAWREAHPDWRVIEDAQAGTGSAMIEVPEVEIAGWKVGPVWFTHRDDPNFHEYMSGMMDSRVEGALGGNALGHFVMTVDYPRAAAWFRCVTACGDAGPR